MRILQRIIRTLRNLLLLVLAFGVGAVLVLTLTEKGQVNLAGIISDRLSGPDRKISIGGLSGIWNGRLRLDHLVVEDSQGPWLVLRGIEVDWWPSRLVTRRFQAQRVHVSRVEVARLPGPAEGESSSGGFSLPLSLDIDAIDLPEIALGEALAGSGIAELAASGSLVAEANPLTVNSNLKLTRTDGVAGSLVGQVVFEPSENRLQLGLDAAEPAGGIIANLLELPGDPAVAINVSGSGPLADWKGTGSFSIDGAVVARIDGTHQQTDGGNRITAKGNGDFSRFAPEMLRPLIAGGTDFDFAGTLGTDGAIAIDHAQVDSASLGAEASGSINISGASDFAVQLNAKNGAVPLSFGPAERPVSLAVSSASARVFGDGRQPMLDLSASLASVDAGEVSASGLQATLHSDGFDLQTRTGPVAVDLTATSVVAKDERLAPLLAGPVSVKASGELGTDNVTITSGTVATATVGGTVTGTAGLAGGTFALDINANVANAALPEGARALLDERVTLIGSISRDAAGTITAKGLDVSSGDMKVTGDATVGATTLEAKLAGTIGDVARFARQAKGTVAFNLTAAGERAAPDLVFELTSAGLSVADRQINDLRVEAKGRADFANPSASVTIDGTVGGVPLKGNAVLETSGSQRTVRDLLVTLGENRIEGDLTLGADFVPLGTLSLKLPDIGPLAALALESAEGDINGSVRFTREDGRPQVAADAAVKSLKRGDISARDVSVKLTVVDYLSAPTIAGQVRAATVAVGWTNIRSVDVRLTRDGAWTGFDGGLTVSDIPARAAGRVKVEGGTTTVELKSGEATVRGIAARLQKPSTVTVRNATATLNNLALGIGGGSVTASGTAGKTLALDARLASVPASIANNFAPGLGVGGTVSGTVKVTGAAASPTIAYDIDWRGASTAQTTGAGFGGLSVKSTGKFTGGRLTFDTTLSEGSGISLRGGGSVNTTGARGLDLAFNGNVPFQFLAGRLAPLGMALNGTAAANITVRGTIAQPVIGGTVRTSGARLVDARSGIAVNDISADIALGGGRATVNRLTGSISGGGTISASGTVGMAGAFPADLRIRLSQARYTDGRVVTTTADGDLTVTGPLTAGPTIGGKIHLGRTVITVPERLPSSLAELDVQHRNAPAAVIAQQEAIRPPTAGDGASGRVLLDIKVFAPQAIFVQGRGINAEFGGSVQLTGPTASPQAVGHFDLVRGRLQLLSRQLTFSRGSLGFSGSLIPYLDFAADSTVGDATVTVAVSGLATNPRFTFSSSPALPEDEVLARLVFGRSLNRLSAIQIAQLAEAAGQLAGVGGSTSLLDRLRTHIGVDDLNVVTDEKGNTAVQAGKYLNDRTYLTIEAGDKAGSSRATIDLNVGRGVKLRGSAADSGEAKGGIFFEREY
jgi:translocation and assembly module TamB